MHSCNYCLGLLQGQVLYLLKMQLYPLLDYGAINLTHRLNFYVILVFNR